MVKSKLAIKKEIIHFVTLLCHFCDNLFIKILLLSVSVLKNPVGGLAPQQKICQSEHNKQRLTHKSIEITKLIKNNTKTTIPNKNFA